MPRYQRRMRRLIGMVIGALLVFSLTVATGCDRDDGPGATQDPGGDGVPNAPASDVANGEGQSERDAGAIAPPAFDATAEVQGATVTIEVYNGCTEVLGYCVKRADGRETHASKGPSTYEKYELIAGDVVTLKDENDRCGAVVLEVDASTSSGTRVDLCK